MEVDYVEIIELELKYCATCVGLWLRPVGEEEVYCASCVPKMAEYPLSRVVRSRLPVGKGDEFAGRCENLLAICCREGMHERNSSYAQRASLSAEVVAANIASDRETQPDAMPGWNRRGVRLRENRCGERHSEEKFEWGAQPDLWLYRDRTSALLRRYLRLAVEVGRLPTLLGREFFRARGDIV